MKERMTNLSDKEIESILKSTVKKFRDLPSAVDDLLKLLTSTEVLLRKVAQSPARSMYTALSPLMSALVSEKLLKHSNVNVQVGVASCISEITRITAPDAPYDDDKMKDVFQLMVSIFKDISDISSESYQKRATILEIAAKLRSCVVMLDLECDELVIEMFQHFLKAIRVDHEDLIFSSMEAIMTVIIEESEEISPDLLEPILSTLKVDNKAARPIAKKLAERVIRCCADKLRPYLLQALEVLDACVEDYSEVIASVCLGNNGSAAHCNSSILKYQQGSAKSTVANGADETMADANSGEESDPDSAKSSDVGTEEPAKVKAKVAGTKGKQPSSEIDSEESSDTHGSDKQQSEQVLCNKEDASGAMKKRRLGYKLLAEKLTKESASPEEDEMKNDGVNGSDSETISDLSEKLKVSNEENVSGRKKLQDTSSFPKKQKHLQKHLPAKKAKKDNTLIEEVEYKNGGGSSSDSETQSLDLTEKLRGSIKRKGGESQVKKTDGKKIGVKVRREKDVSGTSARKDDGENMIISPKSPLKSTKDEGSKDKTPKMSTKRKQTPGTGQAPDFGEDLVGSKIKVWWPMDRMFYEGVVHSFAPAKKKHKVVYVDGDQELLNLNREKWEFVGDEGKAVEHSSGKASSDVKKKSGTSSYKSKSKDTVTKPKGKSNDGNKSKSSANSDDETMKSKASGKEKAQGSNATGEKKQKK